MIKIKNVYNVKFIQNFKLMLEKNILYLKY